METVLLGLCGIILLILVGVGMLLRKCYRELRIMKDQLELLSEDADSQLEVLDRIDRVARAQMGREGVRAGGPEP